MRENGPFCRAVIAWTLGDIAYAMHPRNKPADKVCYRAISVPISAHSPCQSPRTLRAIPYPARHRCAASPRHLQAASLSVSLFFIFHAWVLPYLCLPFGTAFTTIGVEVVVSSIFFSTQFVVNQ